MYPLLKKQHRRTRIRKSKKNSDESFIRAKTTFDSYSRIFSLRYPRADSTRVVRALIRSRRKRKEEQDWTKEEGTRGVHWESYGQNFTVANWQLESLHPDRQRMLIFTTSAAKEAAIRHGPVDSR